MQDLFIFGILGAAALGFFLIKSIMFVIHYVGFKTADELIAKNLAQHRIVNMQSKQIESQLSSFETVANWKLEDPRLTEDLRRQFLTKTKTRRTPTSDRASPRDRVPLATTDFGDAFPNDEPEDSVPIYTYNPSTGGTQV